MLKKKMDEHRYLYDRLKRNTDTLLEEKQRYDEERLEKQWRIDSSDKLNLVSIEKENMKQTKILIEKDKEIDVKIYKYNK